MTWLSSLGLPKGPHFNFLDHLTLTFLRGSISVLRLDDPDSTPTMETFYFGTFYMWVLSLNFHILDHLGILGQK